MKMFNFIQSPISHNLRDPHSKALPACWQDNTEGNTFPGSAEVHFHDI